MPEETFPLLRGRITLREAYQSPRAGATKLPPPPRNPAEHRARLLGQLDAAVAASQVQGRERIEGATRELLVVKPEPGSRLAPDSLSDVNGDVQLVAEDPETRSVILDAPSADLPHLRAKLDHYIDPGKVSRKTGEPRGATALNPIAQIGLATPEDLAGPRFRAVPPPPGDRRWFELAARGGIRRPEETNGSRGQVIGFLTRRDYARPPEFVAPERILFFVHLTVVELRHLIAATDCVLEFDLAGPDVRDWLLFSDDERSAEAIQDFRGTGPDESACSVVLLDSGVTTAHPLLAPAIRQAASAIASDNSPEDRHQTGHGTAMSGAVLFGDLGRAIVERRYSYEHWLQSIKIIRRDREGEAGEDGREFWPSITARAVELADEHGESNRVYAMAVTAPLDFQEMATSWSQAVDQLAYNNGSGRVIAVSAGTVGDVTPQLLDGYPILNLQERLNDPAQGPNVLTVGGYTELHRLPPDPDYENHHAVGVPGGLSPNACTGPVRPRRGSIKPEVVFEAGNVSYDGALPDRTVPTLTALSTGRDWVQRPLALMFGTSLATARAARFMARLRSAYPDLWPQTVRGLAVHSASWTPTMWAQFPNMDERLAAFGYGVPDEDLAAACVRERATVIVEDQLANGTREQRDGKTHLVRRVHLFRFPVPEEILLDDPDLQVELRVTLSYFAEPNTLLRREYRGLDLGWDMQGPTENEADFRRRVNKLQRPDGRRPEDMKRGFGWEIGPDRRRKGTVQSDRWNGPASHLSGSKLIAVYPILGWWSQRKDMQEASMRYALIVTVRAPGLDVYTPIRATIETPLEIDVQV